MKPVLGTPPLTLGDVKSLANLALALDAFRGSVAFRPFTRNDVPYVAVSGAQSAFGRFGLSLSPGAYRLDSPALARYLNPEVAAARALSGSQAALTVGLIVGQDALAQLFGGSSLLDPGFLGHTLLDVGEGLVAAVVGAAAGARATAFFMNPAAGIITNIVFGKLTGIALDAVEQMIADSLR